MRAEDELRYLKGVGPARAEKLAAESLLTVEDLLYVMPFRWEDRRAFARVADLLPGGPEVTLDVRVQDSRLIRTRKRNFSIFQALRALTSKKVGIGLEFHVVAQKPDGSFALVTGQSLDEKLNLDLNRLEVSRLGQFRGDFDGDGRVDFVHLGRGKTITIHRGQPGGRSVGRRRAGQPGRDAPRRAGRLDADCRGRRCGRRAARSGPRALPRLPRARPRARDPRDAGRAVNRDPARDLPILTDVVELHATGSFPQPERVQEAQGAYAGGLLSDEDVAALQAMLVGEPAS